MSNPYRSDPAKPNVGPRLGRMSALLLSLALLAAPFAAQAANLFGATAIASGDSHSCAVVANGAMKCWGNNQSGQLGNGSGTTPAPGTVVDVSGLTSAFSVSLGTNHSCAALPGSLVNATGRTVRCWGENGLTQLGNNTTTSATVPRDVYFVGGAFVSNAQSVAVGSNHSCALMSNGTVKCWGSNDSGQVGNGTTVVSRFADDVLSVSGATSLAAGDSHTCAANSGGDVRCWGSTPGNGSSSNASTSRAVIGAVANKQLSAGRGFTCALADGSVQCWGEGTLGQLGNGASLTSLTPVAVSGLSGVTAISSGSNHTCALLTGGSVKCWGFGRYGQLGNGTKIDINNTPVEVTGLTGATALAAGGYRSCALVNSGVRCWGYNSGGALGDGTTTDRSTPVAVQDSAATGTLTTLSADPSTLSLTASSSYTIPTITATFNEGSTKVNPAVIWTSNSASVPAPTGSGSATAPSVSADTTAVWTASYTEGAITKTTTVSVTVKALVTPTSLVITGDTAVSSDPFDDANLRSYTATAKTIDGKTAVVTATTWASSDTAAATISSSGNLVAKPVTKDTPVTLTATYTLNGVTVTATLAITIKPKASTPSAAASLTITCPATLAIGATQACTAVTTFADGSTKPNTTATYRSGSTTLLSVSGASLTGLKVIANTKVTIQADATEGGVAITGFATVTVLASDANRIMNWAEKKFPEYFKPATITTVEGVGYVLRSYSAGIYVGVADGHVYVLGPPFGPALIDVGLVSSFMPLVVADGF